MKASINKKQLEEWNSTTFGSMLKKARNKDDLTREQKEHFTKLLKRLRKNSDFIQVTKREVNGYISKGWEDLNIRGPLIQESLEEIMTLDNWTPAEYLFNYYLKCFEFYEGTICEYDLGRTLRNLPSYLREYYLVHQLNERGLDCEAPSAEVNASAHVDLISDLNGNSVYMWSYLNTPKSLSYLHKKLNSRGKIMDGLNLLMPLHLSRDTEDILGWLLSSDEYVDEIFKALETEPIEYQEVASKTKWRRKITLFQK